MLEIRDLHEPLMRFLEQKGIPYIRARSDQKSTIAKGWPDFTLLYAGRVLCLEGKTEKGSLSRDQQECIARLAAAGTPVHVVRSIEAAIELVTAWHDTVIAAMPASPPQPAALKKPPQEAGRLVLFGAMVYRDSGSQLLPVRIATADDRLRLPPLTR